MAQLDKESIAKLVQLCRIACTEEEQETLLNDLRKILNHIEQLNEVDTSAVSSQDSVLEGITNVFREDEIGQKTLSREEFLANSPAHIGGMIRVPPVLKNS